MPATPLYFDDIEVFLPINDWVGEDLAIREFNESHELRKIQCHPHFRIPRFFALHVLDHPIRNGSVRPRLPLRITRI